MKKFPSIIFKIFLIFLAVVSAAGIYLWHEKGLRYYSVQSGSMTPTLKAGDLVVNEKVQFTGLKPGDIISYISPVDQRLIITHRIVKMDQQKGLVTTRGDNNVSPDTPVSYSSVLGKTTASLPFTGYLLDSLRNPLGLALVIYIPVIILAAAEIKKLVTKLNKPYKHANLS